MLRSTKGAGSSQTLVATPTSLVEVDQTVCDSYLQNVVGLFSVEKQIPSAIRGHHRPVRGVNSGGSYAVMFCCLFHKHEKL